MTSHLISPCHKSVLLFERRVLSLPVSLSPSPSQATSLFSSTIYQSVCLPGLFSAPSVVVVVGRSVVSAVFGGGNALFAVFVVLPEWSE